MTLDLKKPDKIPYGLLLLIFVQILCVIFFVVDIITDYRELSLSASKRLHLNIEAIATVSLAAAVVFEMKYIFDLLRRKAHLEQSVSIATAAMHNVIEAHFKAWGLTPSEADVATFLVKGFGTGEIAQMRGNAEGTIKSHLNSIYRKSNTGSRSEVLSLIIDSLMEAPEAQ